MYQSKIVFLDERLEPIKHRQVSGVLMFHAILLSLAKLGQRGFLLEVRGGRGSE